jgi:hypothetical protein
MAIKKYIQFFIITRAEASFFDYDTVPVPEFIDPRFRENKPKTLVFSHRKRAFWACFRENFVYNFGHGTVLPGTHLIKDGAHYFFVLLLPVICCNISK